MCQPRRHTIHLCSFRSSQLRRPKLFPRINDQTKSVSNYGLLNFNISRTFPHVTLNLPTGAFKHEILKSVDISNSAEPDGSTASMDENFDCQGGASIGHFEICFISRSLWSSGTTFLIAADSKVNVTWFTSNKYQRPRSPNVKDGAGRIFEHSVAP